jgi:hypothetical protein
MTERAVTRRETGEPQMPDKVHECSPTASERLD